MTAKPKSKPRPKKTLRPTLAVAGILAAATLAIYLNSVFGPFVFDDFNSIAANPTIRHLWPPWAALSPPEPHWTVSGRPILNLSLALNYAISGTSVWSYHLVNILIHILAGLTVFGIARRTLERMARSGGPLGPPEASAPPVTLAFVIALLWTVHPLQTESVTYLIQRAESLMGLFYLLTLYAFIRGAEARELEQVRPRKAADEPPRKGLSELWFTLAWFACLLGMATKEVMVSAPVVVILYDRAFLSGSFQEAWRRHWRVHVSLAATWVLLAGLVFQTGNRGGSAGIGIGVSWWSYALTQFPAVVRYLRLAVWPHPLVFDYGTQWVVHPAAVLPYAAVVAALLAATAYACWRRPALGFLGFWFFAILAPTSLVPGNRQTMAEHRMYLALLPVVALGVWAVHARFGKRSLRFFMVLAIGLGWLASRRNDVYRNPIALWKDSVLKCPENTFARDNLGALLAQSGDLAGAAAQFSAVVGLKPDDFYGHLNWGTVLLQSGKPADAAVQFREAIRIDPSQPVPHQLLEEALKRAGH